jgi:hypothetical protein
MALMSAPYLQARFRSNTPQRHSRFPSSLRLWFG